MERFVRYIVFVAVTVMAACACVRQELSVPSEEDGYAWVDIDFGHNEFDEVQVGTKATLDIIPESRISNLYMFMFVNGKRYYSHYFDQSQTVSSFAELEDERTTAWIVNQRTEKDQPATSGTLRVFAPKCTGAQLFLVANIDADMVNISPEKLNMISTISELQNFTVRLNQEITSRNGLFPMSGAYMSGSLPGAVDVTDSGIFPSGETSGRVSVTLERLDAKVMVNVKVAKENETVSNDIGTGESGTSAQRVQRLKEFRPQSWQVVNLPKGCYLPAHFDGSDAEAGFFSTEPVMFETETETTAGTVHGFSFYMMENHEKKKNKESLTNFHERERKNKDAVTGKFDATSGVWTNAPENGTYMVIKGEVVMDVDVSSEAKQQQLSADVTYYVHLGDIKSSLDDYNVNRNTVYTYNITIKGVNNIEVEVESSYNGDGSPASPNKVLEHEPGAEGQVYVAKESIYTFDAHYGQRVFCFDAAFMDTDALTWYVKTPFGKEGVPEKIGDVEIPSGMDYEWVHFMINKEADSGTYTWKSGGKYGTGVLSAAPYSQRNQVYPGDGNEKLMDVVQFISYIKSEKKKHDEGKPSIFKTEFSQEWLDWYNKNNPEHQVSDPASDPKGVWFRDRVYVTVFVDEFYYEKDPVTGEADPLLWKRFVNQPNRLMHILCDNQKSLDGASSLTGSVLTIRQRSIQTPYNADDPDLVSAWGCETEDENADSYLWYYPEETGKEDNGAVAGVNFGNNSVYNGLYNTVRIWGCLDGNSWKDLKWADYLDYDRVNDYTPDTRDYSIFFLKDDKASLQYSAMMRNRDNNGNGVIDMDEVRWYTASIGQLEFMFFGELGLSEESKLYPRKYSTATGKYPAGHPYNGVDRWKLHIVSSTIHNATLRPQILWAEEGVSISAYRQYEKAANSVKCVRNLGFKTESLEYFTKDDEAHRPQDLIVVTRPSAPVTESSVYKFDCRRLNNKSKRFRTSMELEPYDEQSEMARLYEGFITGERKSASTFNIGKYEDLRKMLLDGKSPCPAGYHVPNIREAVIIHLFANDSKYWWGGDSNPDNVRIYTSTYYSMGPFGNGKNGEGKPSWNTSSPLFGANGNINLNGDKSQWIRCVRDWNPSSD